MSFGLLIVSFLGGIFTVLAPCTLPLLPVIIGVGASGKNKHRPYIVITSFAISVLVFSLVLNYLSKHLSISQAEVTYVAGIILIIFGLLMVFPKPRQKLVHFFKIEQKTGEMASKTKKNIGGDIALGLLLGPILQSCSPTYGILIATILPTNFLRGTINILFFVSGMSLLLIVIAIGGRKIVSKLKFISAPDGIARKVVAIIIIITGILITTGLEKKLGIWLTERGIGLDATQFEYNILQDNR